MEAMTSFAVSRRNFLIRGGALAAGAALLGPAQLLAAEKKESAAADVTPTEDLMREHGVLRRLLLIYDELRRGSMAARNFRYRRFRGPLI